MTLNKKDFIEIEFIGKIKDTGEIFDSNTKEGLDEIHKAHNHKNDHSHETNPLVYCLGEGMFLKGVDDYLLGKNFGKHEFELKPAQAFGNRDSKFVQMIPVKFFIQHKIRPIKGAMLNFDGRMGKILSVSGGRVLVDFNHPIAGKEVIYEINVKRKIEDINEKIKAFNDFIFGKEFSFQVIDKEKKVIYEADENFKKFIELFKDKFKEIFNMDLEIKELKNN